MSNKAERRIKSKRQGWNTRKPLHVVLAEKHEKAKSRRELLNSKVESAWLESTKQPGFLWTPELYQKYLKTEHWERAKREFEASDLFTGACYVCGSMNNLDLHHRTYKRIAQERMEDLVSLCRKCHVTAHESIKANANLDEHTVIDLLRRQYITTP